MHICFSINGISIVYNITDTGIIYYYARIVQRIWTTTTFLDKQLAPPQLIAHLGNLLPICEIWEDPLFNRVSYIS